MRLSSPFLRSSLFAAVMLSALGALSLFSSRAFFGRSDQKTSAVAPQVRPEHSAATPTKRFGVVRPAEPLPNFSWSPREAGASFGLFVPNVTAIKSETLATDVNSNTFVNPGDTLMYSVLVSNSGTDAMNVVFTDQLNSNLTLVGTAIASPIATNDAYNVLGNVSISVPMGSGLLANDVNPQGTGTVSAGAGTSSTQGGNVSVAADGSFTYNPPAGFEGTDTFTYALTHSNGKSDMGTVTLTVSGMIWFVNNNAASCTTRVNGCGRLSNPYSTLASFQAENDGTGNNPAANDNIFVYESATTYAGTVTLLSGQKLIGQDATATLATIAGVTVPPNSATLPAMNTGAPATTIGNTVTLNTNTTARGFSISSTTNTGMNDPVTAITGVSVSEVNVTSTTGTAVLFAGLGGTVSFISVSANGAANGISLNGTTGSFTVTGTGAANSGGTIQNTTGNGIRLINAQSISLDRMNIQTTVGSGIKGTGNVVNFSFTNGTINNSNDAATDGANTTDEANIAFNDNQGGTEQNLTGTVTITGNTLTNARYHGVDIFNYNGTISDANISNNTITSSTVAANSQGSGIRLIAFGSATTAANVTKATIANNIISNFPSGAGIMAQGGTANAAGPAGVFGTAGSPTNIISITGNRVAGQSSATPLATQAILGLVNGRGQGNFDISNNGTVANPLTNTFGTTIAVSSFGFANVTATVNNNVIVSNNAVGAQGIGVGTGVTFNNADTPTLTITVNNNAISQTDGNGILAVARDCTGDLNITIKNNNVAAPLGGVRPGIRIDAGNAGSVDDDVCLDISGNTSAGSGGSQGIGLRKQGTSTTTNAFGVEGMGATATPGIETFINAANPAGNGTLLISATSGFSNCSSAPLPPPVDEGNGMASANFCVPCANKHKTAQPGLLARVQQWLNPVFTAFAAPLSYVNLDRAFSKAADTVTPTVTAADRYSTGSGGDLVPAVASNPAESLSTVRATAPARPAKTMVVNSRGEYTIVPTAALSKAMAGELITINGTGSGFTLPAGESTTIMFNATISSSYTNASISNQASVAGTGFSVMSNNLSTDVIQPPILSKGFASPFVRTNGTVNLQFALINPNNSQTLTQTTFTDVLPVGLNVADGTQSACGGTVTTTAATRTISLSGGSLSVGPPCTFNVAVTAGTTEGTLTNTTGAPDSLQSDAGQTASANIKVINAPTFTKAFGASTVALNGTTSLTFTITNASTVFPLNAIGFTDTLPAGLIVATPSNGLSTTCNGTPSATAGGSSISLSGATLAANTSCTLSVNVTGTTTGAKNNSATLTTTELGASSATTGTVTLTVFAPPTISKAFNPTSIFIGGTFSQLTFTIANPNASGTLTGVGFSDPLPGGLQVDASPGVVVGNCGGSVDTSSFTAGATTLNVSNAAVAVGTNCTIRVNISGTTAGAKPNTTTAITSTEGGTGVVSNTATLNVFTAPQIAKSFGAGTIPVGGTTTLTFVITNPAANPGALTTITFIDSLPPGLVVANPNGVSNTCSGSVTAVAGSGTVSLGGASIATPGNTCQVQVNVTGSTAGIKNNSVTVSSGNGGTGNTSMASLTVASPPTVSKAFSPSLIAPGGTSTLTVTLTNPNATFDLTSAALTDTLPSGVTTVNSTAATTCTGGTASQTSGSVSLSGGTIPQGSSCTLTVDVTAATNNTYTNTIAANALTTNAGSNAGPASATLTVANPPTISKAFAPNSILSGGTSTLTITLSNPNSNVPLTLSSPLVDTLPVGVTTVTTTHANTCGGTSSQAGGSVTLTGGTIPAGGSCTLSVNVTSTNAGGNINTIAAGALVTNGGSNANPATATLVVGSAPAITKSFSPTAIKTGATSTMTISITNNNAGMPFNGVSYTDTLPTGLTVPDAAATSACGGTLTVASNVITLTGATIAAGGGNCTTTFTVTGATVGVKNNTVTVDTTNFGTGFTGTGTVTVYDPPTISKSFSPTSIPFGGTSLMTFTLTNPNTFAGGGLSGLAFTDTLPSGLTQGSNSVFAICGGTMTLSAPSTVSFSGGSLGTSPNSCTINVSVTGAQIGMWPNTTSALSSTQTGAGATSNTATLTVTQSTTTTTITNATSLGNTATVVGQSYAVNVTVAPSMGGMGVPTGTVNVSDGSATCSITLSGGSGSCNLTSTSVGAPKTITASYVGDTNFATSSTTASHTVNKADTTLTALTDSPDPSVVGQAYTAGFTLNVTSPGAGTPTGTVSVNDGAGGTCTATLPATSCQLTSIVAGNKTVTFTYNGDSNFNASPSNTAGHGVNKANTTTAITNDTPDPSVFGQNYAVTAAVTVTSPGSGTPTGTISVTDGTNNCTITLPATSCNLPSTSPGAKTLTATYNGDSNFNASSPSAGVPHTVNKADVTVAITSDNPDSSAVGQSVTVVFTVAAAAPGAGTPTGNVVVTVSGGSETCTGTVAAGQCVINLTTAGARTLTATYAGDANFNGGTSPGEPHTVVAPPSIAKSFSPPSTPINGTTALTLTITNPAANTVALTGVAFTDNFPAGLVVSTPLATTNTCGGTVQDGGGGSLNAGDTGVKLVGGAINANSTCTITVNVTPTVAGPHVNLTGNVSSTNGGTGNTATATLLTNTPPTISSNNVSVKAGSSAASFTIASAADPDQPVNTLGITINSNPTTASSNGVTVSNLAIQANGNVTANIATTCAATTATFNLVVTDNESATGTGTLTVTVTANMPPMLSYNAATITAATTPTITPAVGPSDNGTFTIGSVSVSPNNGGLGVLLNQSNGVVTILNALLIGTYTVTVPITDNCGLTNNAQLTVTVVCPTVSLSPATLPNATINTAYPQTISASPAGGNYSFSVTNGLLPAGLTLNSNGSFSGAPTQSGTFNFRVTASGFGGCTAFQDYTLLVNCTTITVNPTSLPNGTIGTAYNQTVSASPAGAYNYAVSSGALPTGLSLNAASGAITGTPTTGGTFNFTITASQGACSGSRSYSVTIACATITLNPASPLPSGQAGLAYSQAITASPAGSYTYSILVGSLPSGLSLNPTTGLLSGLPNATGTFTFTVQALAGGGCTASQSYTLSIVCPTVALSPTSLPNAATGAAYSQTLSAAPVGGNYTYAVTSGSLPTGLNLNSSTGVISGTPTVANTFNFRVTATGFGGCAGFRDYTVTIGGGGCPTISLPATLPNGTVGGLYSNSAAASPAGGYSYTVSSGTLPPGVTLYSSFGLVFGFPTAAGSYTFTITATQGACTGSQSYTVLISAGFASSLTVASDFDGDGKSDVSVFSADGKWTVAAGGNGQTQSTAWGAPYAPYYDLAVSGDYDGDGKTDQAVFRRGTEGAGHWFIKRSSDGKTQINFWGLPTDVPVPGDYDGDGKTDVAVWRGSVGVWFVLRSSDGGTTLTYWGTASLNDTPVPGDYDGDGKTDAAVFRRNGAQAGHWLIKRSSDGKSLDVKWGLPTDVPTPGDYDGDNKTDYAVWRASEGVWYWVESGTAALRTATLGAADEVPVPADYDGDGKADAAVWQPATGSWQINRSSDNKLMTRIHGRSGDAPIPARRN